MPKKSNQEIFKAKLLAIKADLEKQIKELESKPPEFGSDIDHFEEEADEAEAFGTNLGTAQALRGRLSDVNRALEKLSEGTYGVCEKCGKKIEDGVLEVDLESRYCRTCKVNAR
ncbi:MAG TPA: hypothetical protein VJB92_02280 [Candidatus Paceibacterota bacterium]